METFKDIFNNVILTGVKIRPLMDGNEKREQGIENSKNRDVKIRPLMDGNHFKVDVIL